MFSKEFLLSEQYPDASLTAFVCGQTLKIEPRPAIIICPGGGYRKLVEHEKEPIVKFFLAKGFNAYLLKYSINEAAVNYAPLIEAALAIKLVRERAQADNTDPHKIYILGFSSGGHLAASAGTLWNIKEVRDAVGVTDGSAQEGINRPDGMILSYPVITGEKCGHKPSFQVLSGHEDVTQEDIDRFSLEKHVDSTTPPAFIWHTFADQGVLVENTLLFINAMAAAKVPFEAHIFPTGIHGISLCTKETANGNPDKIVPHAECWSELAVKWVLDF